MNVCTHTLSVTAQDGNTALMRAAWYGNTDVVVELVRGGANLDLQNKVCLQQRPSTHVLYSTRNVHTHVVSCTSQNVAQSYTTDMELIMKRQ